MKKFICLAVTCFLMSFCLSAQSLVGTWETVSTEIGEESLVLTLSFNEDGTFTRDCSRVTASEEETTLKAVYREEGVWKLIGKGKRVLLKVKPASVNVESGEGFERGVGKVVEAFKKVEAFTTVYAPRIVSLTEDELILLEAYEDEDGDSYFEEEKYLRK